MLADRTTNRCGRPSAGLRLRVFYSARYAAITCARKMLALNKTRIPTPNATIELTMWPGPT